VHSGSSVRPRPAAILSWNVILDVEAESLVRPPGADVSFMEFELITHGRQLGQVGIESEGLAEA